MLKGSIDGYGDCQKILCVDELCDTNLSGYIDTGEETWRTVEVNTHKPGSLGALIGKRVYQYSTRASTTPGSTNDYTYTYDAVGNVQVVYKAPGVFPTLTSKPCRNLQ